MAIPPDMMAALQGGGAPAGPIPPDMLAALGGGGGLEEPVEPEGALHAGSAAPGDPEDSYREALDSLEQGVRADTDEARINTIMQCMTKIQGELANSQKGSDAMLGGKLDPAQMRRMGAPDQAY